MQTPSKRLDIHQETNPIRIRIQSVHVCYFPVPGAVIQFVRRDTNPLHINNLFALVLNAIREKFNPLKPEIHLNNASKVQPVYLRKQTDTSIKTSPTVLYREAIAVYSEINIIFINTFLK